MQRYTTKAIILTRTDFGEADRIITFLTPTHGKIKAIAKGVRKSRSKMAGALEIFSISQLLILPGKNDISTVMSAKLEKHYSNIVKNLERTQAAYDFMQLINKATQEKPEGDYFHLLDIGFAGLDQGLDKNVVPLWFKAQLLKITGHMPNLNQNIKGQKLAAAKAYNFDFDKMRFSSNSQGKFSPDDIKFLRVALAAASPKVPALVEGSEKLAAQNLSLVDSMLQTHLRI